MGNLTMFGKTYGTVGSSESNLLLQTKGDVKIQWGSKFIDLIKDGKIAGSSSIRFEFADDSESISKTGFYLVEKDEKYEVWLCLDGTKLNLSTDSNSYLSFSSEQELTSELKEQALKNIGFFYESKNDFSKSGIKSGLVYIVEELKFYIAQNGTLIDTKSSENSIYNSQFLPGMIMMYHGDTIPEGWALCDGENGTPDLINKFIKADSSESDGYLTIPYYDSKETTEETTEEKELEKPEEEPIEEPEEESGEEGTEEEIQAFDLEEETTEEPEEIPVSFNIMTYNIGGFSKGLSPNPTYRDSDIDMLREKLIGAFNEATPTIVGFLEMTTNMTTSSNYPTTSFILNDLGFEHIYKNTYGNYKGKAIVAKNIENFRNGSSFNTDTEGRSCIYAFITILGEEILVMDTHSVPGENSLRSTTTPNPTEALLKILKLKQESSIKIRNKIKELGYDAPDKKVIIFGDFNTSPWALMGGSLDGKSFGPHLIGNSETILNSYIYFPNTYSSIGTEYFGCGWYDAGYDAISNPFREEWSLSQTDGWRVDNAIVKGFTVSNVHVTHSDIISYDEKGKASDKISDHSPNYCTLTFGSTIVYPSDNPGTGENPSENPSENPNEEPVLELKGKLKNITIPCYSMVYIMKL